MNELREIIQEAWNKGEKGADTFGAFLDRAANAISEAGYCQGKPPVLSVDKLIDVTWHKVEGESSVSHLRAAAQAQHDADVRFYDKQIVNKENKENL